MSAFGGKADIGQCPLMTQSGHQRPAQDPAIRSNSARFYCEQVLIELILSGARGGD
jgi:hypothetical protein